MADTTQNYVSQRAALLAKLVLTRREGVSVIPLPQPNDAGLDLLVNMDTSAVPGR